MFRNCERCNAELHYSVNYSKIQLVGGYMTVLCTDCHNQWGRLLKRNSLLVQHYVCDLEIQAHVQKGNSSVMRELGTQKIELNAQLFDLAHSWMTKETV